MVLLMCGIHFANDTASGIHLPIPADCQWCESLTTPLSWECACEVLWEGRVSVELRRFQKFTQLLLICVFKSIVELKSKHAPFSSESLQLDIQESQVGSLLAFTLKQCGFDSSLLLDQTSSTLALKITDFLCCFQFLQLGEMLSFVPTIVLIFHGGFFLSSALKRLH